MFLNQTVLGLMHEIGAGMTAGWAVHLAVSMLMTVLACRIWIRPVPQSLKAAASSIGVITATLYMLAYDLTALSVPAASGGRRLARGFLPGPTSADDLLPGAVLVFQFRGGPIILLALMGLVIRRAGLERKAIKYGLPASDPVRA